MDSVCDKASYIVLIMVGQDYSEELSFLTPPPRVGDDSDGKHCCA